MSQFGQINTRRTKEWGCPNARATDTSKCSELVQRATNDAKNDVITLHRVHGSPHVILDGLEGRRTRNRIGTQITQVHRVQMNINDGVAVEGLRGNGNRD